MNRRFVLGILLALVLMAGAVSLGSYTYNLGVAQGMVQSGKLGDLPPGAEIGPQPYYYGGPFWFYRPFGFGFLGCFGPLLFFLLFFGLFRGFWWGGRWGHGPGWKHRHWEHGAPSRFEEWHRQAHGQDAEQTPPSAVGS